MDSAAPSPIMVSEDVQQSKMQLVDVSCRQQYNVWCAKRAALAHQCAETFIKWFHADGYVGPKKVVSKWDICFDEHAQYIEEIRYMSEAKFRDAFVALVMQELKLTSPRWYVEIATHDSRDDQYCVMLRLAPAPADAPATETKTSA